MDVVQNYLQCLAACGETLMPFVLATSGPSFEFSYRRAMIGPGHACVPVCYWWPSTRFAADGSSDEQRDEPLFAQALASAVHSIEPTAGRKPRAIIQIASTISCRARGRDSRFCSEELPPITPYIASR